MKNKLKYAADYQSYTEHCSEQGAVPLEFAQWLINLLLKES